jgi:HD-GYP domain-containing protein (c-di-GMP phosphodiesterase class II)
LASTNFLPDPSALLATPPLSAGRQQASPTPLQVAAHLVMPAVADQLIAQAMGLNFKKRYHEAQQLIQQAYALCLEQGATLGALTCLSHLVWLTFHLEGSEGSSKVSRIVKGIRKELAAMGTAPPVRQAWAVLLHYEALMRYEQGLFGQSIRLLREALAYSTPGSLESARLLDSFAVYHEHIGNFDKAIRLLKQSIDIKRTLLDQPHELAITCQILGRLCLLIEHLDEAQTYLLEARQRSHELDDQPRVASLTNDLIKITILNNDLAMAQNMITEAQVRHQEFKLWAQYGTTLLYKTFVLFLQQDFTQADTLLHQEILPIFEQHPDKKGYGIAKRLQSALYQVYGRRSQAIETMSEAIAIFQKQRRMDELAKSYFELAKLYVAMNQPALAKEGLLEALKIAEQNSLAFLVAPIEDELFRLDTNSWEQIVDRRVRHQPLFSREHNLLEALLEATVNGTEDEAGVANVSAKGQPRALLALLRVGQAIAAEHELSALLRTVKDETERALDADRCSVFVYDRETKELWSQVAGGIELAEEIRFPAHAGLAGYVFKTGELLNIANAYEDPRFNQDVDRQTQYRTHNILCGPIRNRRGEVIGVFQVLNKRQGSFSKADEDLLSAIAATAGVSIDNAMLAQDQKKAFESFIVTLSSTIDARDPITAGHSERVAEYSLLVADELSMSGDDRQVLKYASLLHDIGKIGVREEVLVKDGRLTIEEYRHIQEHARFTHEILQNIHFERHLAKVPEIAASHHEKMDGTGYFRGLKGTEIPLQGRILALSDVFDAITSRRHYRNRMAFDRVLGILRKDAGSHFDPDCVDLFFKVPLYRIANVLVKERLFNNHGSTVQNGLKFLDTKVTLGDFELILASQRRTKQEEDVLHLFSSLYYEAPTGG